MKRILIADDDDSMKQLLAVLLTKEGYEVVAVNDGAEALRAYGTAMRECKPFSVIAVDCAMPNMTGTTLASRLRELCDDVPIIFLTAHPQSLMADDVKRYDISDVFEKPFDSESFTMRIKGLMDKV